MNRYLALSEIVLGVHLLFILWVALWTLVTWNRFFLRWAHIVSLVYSILLEVLPWPPCPLTILEQALEGRAGMNPYRGLFVLHYLDATVYPNVPQALLVACGVAVCLFKLGLYLRRFWRRQLETGNAGPLRGRPPWAPGGSLASLNCFSNGRAPALHARQRQECLRHA